jgi:hypothetical protein
MTIMQGGNSGGTTQQSVGAYQHVQGGISSVSVPTAQSSTTVPSNQGKNSAGGGSHHQHHPTSVSL